MSPLTGNRKWNQALMTPSLEEAFSSIFVICLNEGTLAPIGNGFILNYNGDKAIGATAKHNIDAIRCSQGSRKMAHHSSISPFFRPPVEALDIGPEHTKAVMVNSGGVDIHDIGWVVEIEGSDLAFCALMPQQNSGAANFSGRLIISPEPPTVGDVFCVMGLNFGVLDSMVNGLQGKTSIEVQKIMRAGAVMEIFQERHLLTDGSGFRTTFPVEGGLSGAPVIKYTEGGSEMVVYGVVSQHALFPNISDFTVSGDTTVSSFAALHKFEIEENGDMMIQHNDVIISNSTHKN
jgi:hypothetical protein